MPLNLKYSQTTVQGQVMVLDIHLYFPNIARGHKKYTAERQLPCIKRLTIWQQLLSTEGLADASIDNRHD